MDILIRVWGAFLVLYLIVACVTFQIRNPKANDYVIITELRSVLRFEKIPEYQK